MIRLLAAALAAFLCVAALPVQSASPEDVRKVVLYLLQTDPKMEGLASYKKSPVNDAVMIKFTIGDLSRWRYEVAYQGSYRVTYPMGPDLLERPNCPLGCELQYDQPNIRVLPQEERRLSIVAENLNPLRLEGVPGPRLNIMHIADLGLTGKPSFAFRTRKYVGFPFDPEAQQQWQTERKYSDSFQNHPCCSKNGLEFERVWQQHYDDAIERVLEFYKNKKLPNRVVIEVQPQR